nr:MAG TPA: hypothetical protein [Caudoviricetes sp.]
MIMMLCWQASKQAIHKGRGIQISTTFLLEDRWPPSCEFSQN